MVICLKSKFDFLIKLQKNSYLLTPQPVTITYQQTEQTRQGDMNEIVPDFFQICAIMEEVFFEKTENWHI